MILTDPFVIQNWHPGNLTRYCVEAALVVAVIAVGKILCRKAPPETQPRDI